MNLGSAVDRALIRSYRLVARRPNPEVLEPPVGPVNFLRGRWLGLQCDNRPRGLQLAGRPTVLRHHGSHLRIGDRTYVAGTAMLCLNGPGSTIDIGADCLINFGARVIARRSVTIGDDSLVGWDTTICDTDFHRLIGTEPDQPVRIGNHVWIGAGVIVLKGVTIGDGAVVAAGSLVTSDVAPATLVAGRPARVMREGVEWER